MNSSNNMGDNNFDGDVKTPGSVSRSGRVRKKNSLLDDYDSTDIIEKRKRRGEKSQIGTKNDRNAGPRSHLKSHAYGMKKSRYQGANNMYNASNSYIEPFDEDVPHIAGEEVIDETILDEDEETQMSNKFKKLKSQAQSTYMMEKSFLKQRKFTGPTPSGTKAKAPRKDKGTPRVTAYMLWTKSQSTQGRSIMDLRDLWATLPLSQKKIWKTKAAKIMKKKLNGSDNMKNSAGPRLVITGKEVPVVPQRKGMKNTTPQEVYVPKRPPGRPPKKAIPPIPVVPGPSKTSKPTNSKVRTLVPTLKPVATVPKLVPVSIPEEKFQFKVCGGTSPLDVAARLSLLGEQMKNIAEDFKNKKDIATTDSLSVLMDSLLCSIPALLALTKQVPELDCIPESQLRSVLNNTDYIMPGL